MRHRFLFQAGLVLLAGATLGLLSSRAVSPAPTQAATEARADPTALDRTTLPIPEPDPPHATVLDARDATPPPRFQVKAPAKAPNVLILLIDDMGFGMPSSFGGPVHMPNSERLAKHGLRYNHFHTTALCSPTRSALLTGRNHHTNNMGGITELATAFPGDTGQRPNNVAPLAEMLRLNGYCTSHFGKAHETAAWELSPSGPTDRWPTRSGMDKFYGFLGGETNQWEPLIYEDMAQVEPPKDPGYHFLTDMTNQSIKWVRSVKSLTPDRPFFLYYAPGAAHAPHHVPKEWIEKYRGKFDSGWDAMRRETLARQIALGVVPAGTKLAPKPEAIKDWDALSADEKRLFARQMEIFAGYGEFVDAEAGRLIDAIEGLGQLENTLVFYILGDNGSSTEGGFNGMFNEMTYFNGVVEKVEDILKHYDELGGPMTYNHMSAGWSVAGDAPFTWTKQVASSYGGTRNGMVVHWPAGIRSQGEVRTQWHHVIDVAPTVLEAAGLPQPKSVNGTVQAPIEGVSFAYSFDRGDAAGTHNTQYFEIAANRSIYHDGWLAGTVHKVPWEEKPRAKLTEDRWELYDTRTDFSLANDLAARNPTKLAELQALFLKEAVKYRVLPLDDRTIERFNSALAGRPDLMQGRTKLTVYPGMRMFENAFINVKNCSLSLTAEVEIPDGGARGVIICQGGRFGGWSLYCEDGKITYHYNYLGLERFTVQADRPTPPGKATVVLDFAYDGGGPGKGGEATIRVGGEAVARGRIGRTQPNIFSVDDTADVGLDGGTPVFEGYAGGQNPFNGAIGRVVVDIQPKAR